MLVNKTELIIKQGDITQQDTDAVVNAANSTLLGGGGVDGAIHRAGGPEILEECKNIVINQGRCQTGDAVITTGGNLLAKKVIHTVGPVWQGGQDGEDEILYTVYTNSLKLGKENGMKSISFPSISTGAFGYPIHLACRVALQAVSDFAKENGNYSEVRFILFSEDDFKIYEKEMAGLEQSR